MRRNRQSTPPIQATPSHFLAAAFHNAKNLPEGENIAIAFDSREAAKRALYWFFHERRREIKRNRVAMLKGERVIGGIDSLRGIVTYLSENSLIIERPKPPAYMTITRADGRKEKIKFA